MTVSDPTTYQVLINLTSEQYSKMLERANAAGYGTVQEYFIHLGEPAPLTASSKVIHSVEPKEKVK